MGEKARWSTVLRALREARGVTQDGWAARLGVSRATVQRWESGDRAPDPSAEDAVLTYCRETGLFRSFDRGPLAGLTLTADSLRDLLTEGRLEGGNHPVAGSTISPQPTDTRLREASGASGSGASDPQRAVANARQSNLPAPLTSFVGRQQEIAAVRRRLGGTRLLTLTGVGGCGKTRLALELAGELLWAYPNGIWLVELAALADPALLAQTVAAALSLRATGDTPIRDVIVEQLSSRQLLLILDNCEHLLPSCAELAETLLRACPHLEILSTSREPLGVNGETIWRVPPMSLPAIGDKGQGEAVVSYATESSVLPPGAGLTGSPQSSDAVRLFVERARQYQPDFELLAANESAVVQICRWLDGIPLAIELAAARVTALSPEQIAERLSDRFRLLTGGSRTALPRHQTLRAALDWSYDLLSEPERALLRRLAVFAGGFTLEAAEAFAENESALDLVTRLIDKSLVVAEVQDGEARYRMLETVRQHAEEKLADAGEAEAARDLHAAWCLALAEAAEQNSRGPEQGAWLERLAAEYGNMRAALRWRLSDGGDVTLGLRLAGKLSWFWEARGDLSEGRRWLETLLARGAAAPPDVRCAALDAAGMLARYQGELDVAVRRQEQSLALARELGDDAAIARSLNGLAISVAWADDLVRARTLFEESLSLQQRLGNRRATALTLMDLGNVASDQGDPERSATLYEEGLPIAREAGDLRLVATLLQNLGNRNRNQGAPELAAARYHEALSLYRELQDRIGILRCLRVIAHLTLDRGDAARVARLCGAAAILREQLGVAFQARGDAAFEQTCADARAALGDDQFAAEWAAGQALSQEQATAEALAATTASPDTRR